MDSGRRVAVSALLVIVGIILASIAAVSLSSEPDVQVRGCLFDFGELETSWAEMDVSEYGTEQELLVAACDSMGYSLEQGEDGRIASIDGRTSEGTWDLWVVYPDSTDWTKIPAPYSQDPSEYTVSCWALRSDGEVPNVAVDYTGRCIYGYPQQYRVVSLSPSITEILCSVKADNIIVGADSYSNYPESFNDRVSKGKIDIVGSYSAPSFELIVGTNPGMVMCDGSQNSHVQMAGILRNAGYESVVLYPGESIDCILDNIFITGVVLSYDLAAKEVMDSIQASLDAISEAVLDNGAGKKSVMFSLEPDISPWVSGEGTYIHSAAEMVFADNVFSEWFGWVHITSDRIAIENPEVIIVMTSSYRCTQEEYDILYEGLSAQWRSTDAWKDGEVYVLCEGASEMAQRLGPRIPCVTELIAKILHPGAFEIKIPKIIGDDYASYLEYDDMMAV